MRTDPDALTLDAIRSVPGMVRGNSWQVGEQTQTRWTPDAIRSQLVWGRDAALRRIARILDRLGITWQRARRHGHRPDPHDQANLQEIADVVEDARAHPNQVVTVSDQH